MNLSHDSRHCGGPVRCTKCRTQLLETPQETVARLNRENAERGQPPQFSTRYNEDTHTLRSYEAPDPYKADLERLRGAEHIDLQPSDDPRNAADPNVAPRSYLLHLLLAQARREQAAEEPLVTLSAAEREQLGPYADGIEQLRNQMRTR